MSAIDKLRKAVRWVKRKTTVGDYRLKLKAEWIDEKKSPYYMPRKEKP